jgi:hypothetical protein
MMRYTVRSHTESFQTDSLDEAHSVMESMASYFGCASIIDNTTNKIIEEWTV